jgi:hypothetical protein
MPPEGGKCDCVRFDLIKHLHQVTDDYFPDSDEINLGRLYTDIACFVNTIINTLCTNSDVRKCM